LIKAQMRGELIMYITENDISKDHRVELCQLMNQRLADSIDLQLQMKQAHWNVKGPNFIALHKLFDEIHTSVGDYVDSIAERIVQLGGIAEGTIRMASAHSKLSEYPDNIAEGLSHVDAISGVLATYGQETRETILELTAIGDAVSADIFTEISRGIDKWLWFVEAHSQAKH
jgi:starvation-inducible DNA-binding protein